MKCRSLLFAFLVACAAPASQTAELSERGSAMVDAMIGAMDAMGLIERGRKHRGGSGNSGDWSSGFPSSGFNMPGTSSFGSSPSGFPGSGFGMPGSSPFGGWSNPMSPWSSMPMTGGGMPWSGGGMPWSGGGMPWAGGGMPWGGGMPRMPFGSGGPSWPAPAMGNMPWPGPQDKPTSSEFLDGAWEGQAGELLLIRGGMFRIYADSETYRDGHLQVRGNRLQLKDVDSGRTRDYEMRYQADQLALGTPEGDVLLYRRISVDAQGY